MKIKINEYSKGMRFLTSDQGDYSPNAPDIFVQEKPNYRMPSLEPGFEDGGRVGFSKAGLVETKPFFNQMTGKNHTQTEINRIKKFGVEKYKKLDANQRKAIRNGDPGTRFMTEEKKAERAKKPTPVFEGTPGRIVGVKFKDKAQEKAYKDLLKQRYSVPKGSKQKISNETFMKKFGISSGTMERVNRQLAKELNLKHPLQTYEGKEKIIRARDKLRKENIKKTSSGTVESKIKRDIKKVDATALANDVDIAHRASLKANANLGVKYLVSSLGVDPKIVNQSLVKPTEQKLGKLYNDQQKLIKGLKPGKVPKNVQKKIEKLNIKISELSDRTKGALQGVLIDEKTLKPSIYGVDYKKVLGAGLIDKPVSELTQADRDIIKLNVGEQIKTAKKFKPSSVTLGSNFANLNKDLLDFRKLPGDVRNFADIALDAAKSPAALNAARKLKTGLKFTGLGLAGEAAFAAPFALSDYAAGKTGDRILGNATFGLFGETEKEETRKATGDLGYATQTINELQDLIPRIGEQYNLFNDKNDPTFAQRDKFKRIYDINIDKYNKAYNKFVDNEGQFNNELYNQALNNYTAGINQISKFDTMRAEERPDELTGLESYDVGLAGGGLAKLAGKRSGTPPESGPTPQGLDYLLKRGRQY